MKHQTLIGARECVFALRSETRGKVTEDLYLELLLFLLLLTAVLFEPLL